MDNFSDTDKRITLFKKPSEQRLLSETHTM